MTPTQFQAAINANLVDWQATNFPALPVVFEDGPAPAQDSIGPIWLDATFRWFGSQSTSVGITAGGRYTGAVSLMVYYRPGEGTAQREAVLESLKRLFKHRRIGGATLGFPQRATPTEALGWRKAGLLVPFNLDEV